jgi:hypothetical protein
LAIGAGEWFAGSGKWSGFEDEYIRKSNSSARQSGFRGELLERMEHAELGKNCRVGTPCGQAQSSPVKPSQTKSSQIKPNQTKSNQKWRFDDDSAPCSRIFAKQGNHGPKAVL